MKISCVFCGKKPPSIISTDRQKTLGHLIASIYSHEPRRKDEDCDFSSASEPDSHRLKIYVYFVHSEVLLQYHDNVAQISKQTWFR